MGGADPSLPASARIAVGLPSRTCAKTTTFAPGTSKLRSPHLGGGPRFICLSGSSLFTYLSGASLVATTVATPRCGAVDCSICAIGLCSARAYCATETDGSNGSL